MTMLWIEFFILDQKKSALYFLIRNQKISVTLFECEFVFYKWTHNTHYLVPIN